MAMEKSAADAFVYAKASGMLARSFIGEKAQELFNVNSLQELWSLLFKKEMPAVPETLLAKELETEAQNNFIREYKKLISNYSHPSPVLVSLIHYYDYDNLKQIGESLYFNEKKLPAIVDTNPYNIINYSKWPNIAAMTADTSLSWFNKTPDIHEQQKNDYRLDCQFINEIWSAANKISSGCKKDVVGLLEQRFRMINTLWAIRLRVYYRMEKEEILENLVYAEEEHDSSDVLACDAIKTLDWELDDYNAWKHWKYSSLLNPHEEGTVWNIDPRWIYNGYKKLFADEAHRLFHTNPFTECPLVCWFFIKQNEIDNIRTASECLRLHVKSAQAMEMAGVSEVKNG